MIVIGSIIAISLIGAYIFLGMKISESIVNADIKIFFWALYFVTLMTIINVSISSYFYSSIINKKGPLGPRGSKGKMGDKGESGICNKETCRINTVRLIIEQAIQEKTKESDITPMEKKIICSTVNDNKDIIEGWTFNDLESFKKELNFSTPLPLPLSYNERVKEQNKSVNLSDELGWLKKLIETPLTPAGKNLTINFDIHNDCGL